MAFVGGCHGSTSSATGCLMRARTADGIILLDDMLFSVVNNNNNNNNNNKCVYFYQPCVTSIIFRCCDFRLSLAKYYTTWMCLICHRLRVHYDSAPASALHCKRLACEFESGS